MTTTTATTTIAPLFICGDESGNLQEEIECHGMSPHSRALQAVASYSKM